MDRLRIRLGSLDVPHAGRARMERRRIRGDDEPSGEEPMGGQSRGDPLGVDVLDLVHDGQPSTSQATDVDAGTALLR